MAEFLTMAEAEDKFGKKGRTNAALTLGIIGTALGAFAGNNGGCGCSNGGGLLGNLFGGNNNCCAMQAAENAKTLAMAQGQQADNLSWANRVQSLQDGQRSLMFQLLEQNTYKLPNLMSFTIYSTLIVKETLE